MPAITSGEGDGYPSPFLVRRWAIDLRQWHIHQSQIDRQLSAMVDEVAEVQAHYLATRRIAGAVMGTLA